MVVKIKGFKAAGGAITVAGTSDGSEPSVSVPAAAVDAFAVEIADLDLVALAAVSAPTLTGTGIADETYTQGSGPQTIAAATVQAAFTGLFRSYSINGSAAASINSSTGEITIDTTNVVAGTTITVTAANVAGNVQETFTLTVSEPVAASGLQAPANPYLQSSNNLGLADTRTFTSLACFNLPSFGGSYRMFLNLSGGTAGIISVALTGGLKLLQAVPNHLGVNFSGFEPTVVTAGNRCDFLFSFDGTTRQVLEWWVRNWTGATPGAWAYQDETVADGFNLASSFCWLNRNDGLNRPAIDVKMYGGAFWLSHVNLSTAAGGETFRDNLIDPTTGQVDIAYANGVLGNPASALPETAADANASPPTAGYSATVAFTGGSGGFTDL